MSHVQTAQRPHTMDPFNPDVARLRSFDDGTRILRVPSTLLSIWVLGPSGELLCSGVPQKAGQSASSSVALMASGACSLRLVHVDHEDRAGVLRLGWDCRQWIIPG